jgi:glycosyltransferase involved in cell wall biosynthesis
MSAPAVTVLVPVFNGAAHLRESLESILRQRFCDFELLVIDDGSTDDTARILDEVEDRRLRVLRNETNLGLVATLNRGLAEARGEWIARQDADDISAPGRLIAQMSFARGNPSVPVVGADAWLINEAGRFCGRWRTAGHADLVAWDLCFRAPFAHGSALFRRSIVMERFGGYRDLPACEDLDLWSRVAADFPVVTLRQPLVKYRLHAASIMAGADGSVPRKQAVRDILDRHIQAVAPGLGERERSLVASVWSDCEQCEWSDYFDAVKMLSFNFCRGRGMAPGFHRVIADQYYALFFRARRSGTARAFLCALAKAQPSILPRMPWLRMLAATIRK